MLDHECPKVGKCKVCFPPDLLKFELEECSDGDWGFLVPVDKSLSYKDFFTQVLGIEESEWEAGTCSRLGFDTLRSLYGDRILKEEGEAFANLANRIANRLKRENDYSPR